MMPERTALLPAIAVTGTRLHDLDPEITVYQVSITSAGGIGAWEETFGSRETLEAFLLGLRAGAAMYAGLYIETPEIHRAR